VGSERASIKETLIQRQAAPFLRRRNGARWWFTFRNTLTKL